MPTGSLQSKTFVVLFTIAALGTSFSFWMSNNTNGKKIGNFDSSLDGQQYQITKYGHANGRQTVNATVQPVSTSDWKVYKDEDFKLSFKYPPTWNVQAPAKKQGEFYILQLDPGQKYYNVKIYISPKSYFAMTAIPTVKENIAGVDALNFNNSVFGLKTADYYYTLDIGLSMSLQPSFVALAHTVNFLGR